MIWQFPPLGACIGLLLISIGVAIGFDIHFKFDNQDRDLWGKVLVFLYDYFSIQLPWPKNIHIRNFKEEKVKRYL